MQIPATIATLVAGILLTLASLWYGQNHGLMPTAASETAPLVDGLFNAMMTISTALFLIVQGTLVIAIIKFRRRKGDMSEGSPIQGNVPLEILWTGLPAVLSLGIAVYSVDVYTQMGGLDPAVSGDAPILQITNHSGGAVYAYSGSEALAISPSKSDTPAASWENGLLDKEAIALGIGASPDRQGQKADLAVDVLGLQYAWIFTYPDTGAISGELHLPVGREVQLNMTAQDVIHAFWVPQFRLKQDVIPGRSSQLRFTPTQVGEYPAICAELCGTYHAGMKTRVIVEQPDVFDRWLEEQVASQIGSTSTVANALHPSLAREIRIE